MRHWVDGVQTGTAVHSGTLGAQDGGLSHFNVSRGIASDNNSFDGYFDQIRVTKGVCRYTATFTPPGLPFPTS
jgi:hypothetical protein